VSDELMALPTIGVSRRSGRRFHVVRLPAANLGRKHLAAQFASAE